MKFTMEETNSDFEFLTLPDDTIVQVSVDQIELREVPGSNGREGWQKLSFKFKILELPTKLEDEYAALIGSTIWGSVSARFTEHPDNKLRKWAEALLDIGELEPGFELETEMLIGRKARGVVSTYPKKDGGRNHQIAGLLAANPAPQPALVGGFTIDEEPPF
jgi:hypothetical protein